MRVASPCTADWEKMTGNDRTRFCDQCQKHVYNLSAMSRAQAEALMGIAEGKICVRYYQRHDGTVLTEDCPVGWRKIVKESRRRSALALAACVSVFVSALGLIGCSRAGTSQPKPVPPPPDHREVMGAPANPAPPTTAPNTSQAPTPPPALNMGRPEMMPPSTNAAPDLDPAPKKSN